MGGAESVVRNADKRTSRREHRATFEAAVARFRATPFESTAQASRGSRSAPSRSIRVCVRKRPLFTHEQQQGEFDVISCLPGRVVIHDARMKADMRHMLMNHHDFTFHDVYAETADNEAVYHDTVGGLVSSVMEGGHATLMMYGQTGSGKTYTMRAIHERIAGDIFPRSCCSVTMSFVELLGDNCFDMLNGGTPCNLVTGPDGSVHPFPCVEVPVAGPSEFQALVDMAAKLRATAATGVHDQSSRSHAVCRIFVCREDEPLQEGSLTLVDLAGTEHRVDNAEHNAERQKEGARINASLAALKECVRASAGGLKFIAYRRNRLTQLLRGCFSNEHSTVIIATVSPSSKDTEQSLNTLRHACIMDGQGEAKTNGSTHVTGGVTTLEDLGEINVTKIAREQAAKRRAAQTSRPNDRPADDAFKVAPAHQAKQSNVVRRSQLDRRLQQALAPSLAKELQTARSCAGTNRQRARLERPVVASNDGEEPPAEEEEGNGTAGDMAAPCEAGAGNSSSIPDHATETSQRRRHEGERSTPGSLTKAAPQFQPNNAAPQTSPEPQLCWSNSSSNRAQPLSPSRRADMPTPPLTQLAEADAGAGVAPPRSAMPEPGQQSHGPRLSHPVAKEGEPTMHLNVDAYTGYDPIFDSKQMDVDGRYSEHERRTEESMDSERGKALSLFRHFCREGRSSRIWRKNDLRLINTCVVPELFGRFQIDWAHPQKGLDELERLVREYPLPEHVWHVLADPPVQFKQQSSVREAEIEANRAVAMAPKVPTTVVPKKEAGGGAPPAKMSPRGQSPRGSATAPTGLPPPAPGGSSPSGYPSGGDRSPRLMSRMIPEAAGDRSPRQIPRMPPEVTGERSPRPSGRMSPEVTGRSIRSPRDMMPEAPAKGEMDAMRRARSMPYEVQEEQIANLERQVASTEDGVKRWLGELRAQANFDRQSPPRQQPTRLAGAEAPRPCARKVPSLPPEHQHRLPIRR